MKMCMGGREIPTGWLKFVILKIKRESGTGVSPHGPPPASCARLIKRFDRAELLGVFGGQTFSPNIALLKDHAVEHSLVDSLCCIWIFGQ